MERRIEVRHVTMEVGAGFDGFTRALERSLGRFDYAFYNDLEADPRSVEARLEAAAGEQGLMLFSIQEHGRLLNLVGAPRQAKQYLLGNPLIAVTMTSRDIRAALYAPLRILVYQGDDRKTRVEFDRPSSLFGQFGDPAVAAVARSLDEKLFNLIAAAGRAAQT